MNSESIILGSGVVYVVPYQFPIPLDQAIERPENRIGYLKSGARLSYTPEYHPITDTEGQVVKTVVANSNVEFRCSLNCFNANTLKTVCGGGIDEDGIYTLPTSSTIAPEKYIVRFVQDASSYRLTLVCYSESGMDISFQKASEALLQCVFKVANDNAHPMITFKLDNTATPTEDITITQNNTYAVSGFAGYDNIIVAVEPEVHLQNKTITTNGSYTADQGYDGLGTVTVNVQGGGGTDVSDTTAVETDVIEDKIFHKADGSRALGTIKKDSAPKIQYDSASSTYFNFKHAKPTSWASEPATIAIDTGNGIYLTRSSTGNASASDVIAGKTFTSKSGFAITGTYVPQSATGDAGPQQVLEGYTFSNSSEVGISGSMSDLTDSKLTLYGPHKSSSDIEFYSNNEGYIDNTTYFAVPASSFGNATASDVMSGKKFTSSEGVEVTGTFVPIQPSGTITITENGNYDVTMYTNATVNVAGGGGGITVKLYSNVAPGGNTSTRMTWNIASLTTDYASLTADQIIVKIRNTKIAKLSATTSTTISYSYNSSTGTYTMEFSEAVLGGSALARADIYILSGVPTPENLLTMLPPSSGE